jgi:hypothetical protein
VSNPSSYERPKDLAIAHETAFFWGSIAVSAAAVETHGLVPQAEPDIEHERRRLLIPPLNITVATAQEYGFPSPDVVAVGMPDTAVNTKRWPIDVLIGQTSSDPATVFGRVSDSLGRSLAFDLSEMLYDHRLTLLLSMNRAAAGLLTAGDAALLGYCYLNDGQISLIEGLVSTGILGWGLATIHAIYRETVNKVKQSRLERREAAADLIGRILGDFELVYGPRSTGNGHGPKKPN